MAKDVKFNIKLSIDGKEQIVTASTNLKKFAEELEIARTKSTKLRDNLVKITQVGVSFQNAFSGLQQLTGVLKDYTAASTMQVEAEKKLETVMRQRMAATDEDTRGIKELASAQQALGVIGDEVQLFGAQQIATFLKEKASLETLLPAMNNLLAQQKGFNATTQDAVTVGNLMGKVMQGQTSALTRVGITFDEAEEKVLKYGTEQERAAMLARVITNNVGEMNAALAATDAGKAKQWANTLGDLKEQLGAVFAGIEPIIVAVGEFGMAFTALGTTWQGVRGIVVGMKSLTSTIKISTIATYGQAAASKIAAAATKFWGNQVRFANRMQIAWAFGAKSFVIRTVAMRAAIMGLTAITGVGLAIAAVSAIVSAFAGKTGEAAEKEKQLSDEFRQFKKDIRDLGQTMGESARKEIAALDRLYSAAKDETKSREERAAAIKELQSRYPEYFSSLSAEALNVKDLTTGYEKLRNSILQTARARAAEGKIEENTGLLIDVEQQIKAKQAEVEAMQKSYDAAKKNYDAGRDRDAKERQSRNWFVAGAMAGEKVQPVTVGEDIARTAASEMNKYNEQLQSANGELSALLQKQTELNAANKELAGIMAGAGAGTVTGGPGGGGNNGGEAYLKAQNNLQDYDNAIAYHKKLQQTATREEYRDLQRVIDALEKRRAAFIGQTGAATPTPPGTPGVPVQVPGFIEKLQDRLEDAKKEFGNAVTVEARVEAETKIRDIQAEIDKATRGELSIKADVEPSYVTAGSDADKRQSYNNARNKAERVRTDYEIGIIGKDEALHEIEDINSRLAELGLKPIEFKIEADTEKARSTFKDLREGWSGIQGIEGGIQGITESLEGNGNAWRTVAGVVDGLLGLYQGFQTVIQIIGTLTGVTNMLTAAKQGETVATAAATTTAVTGAAQEIAASTALAAKRKIETTANVAAAASGALAAHSGIPFVGIALGLAAVGAIIAAMATLPKFAKGGIVSGPTLAMIGEYAGAGNNPEVVAPLNKLRDLIEPRESGISGTVKFKIDGRTLVGVLEKENNVKNRS